MSESEWDDELRVTGVGVLRRWSREGKIQV